MSNFNKSQWAQAEAAENFLEAADRFIPERRRLFNWVRSYYQSFQAPGPKRLLELGSGDGCLSETVCGQDPETSVVLLDGSETMLARARERFPRGAKTLKLTFQELIGQWPDLGIFDFVCSSLAIHHLHWAEKLALFRYAFHSLCPGGSLALVDVVLPPSQALETWYLNAWRDWLAESKERQAFFQVPEDYKRREENKPDGLADQMRALDEIGFADVDVFYKNGIFAVFGGHKPNLKEVAEEDFESAWPLGAFDPGL